MTRCATNGRELFYLSGGRMMAVDITARGGALSIGVPVPLFDYAHANVTHPDYYPYAVAPDGQRFLVTRELPRDPSASGTRRWSSSRSGRRHSFPDYRA